MLPPLPPPLSLLCCWRGSPTQTDTGGTDAGVYDALVWGMVCTILDARPALLQQGNNGGGGGGGVRVGAREQQRRRRGGAAACC